jgi:hypothetical protein
MNLRRKKKGRELIKRGYEHHGFGRRKVGN